MTLIPLIEWFSKREFQADNETNQKDYAVAGKISILTLITIAFLISCASSELIRFEKNIQSMSNSELINCYYGINERIKDVDNRMEMGGRSDHTKNQHVINQKYFAGGEIYGLMQKERLVLDEMAKRNLSP